MLVSKGIHIEVKNVAFLYNSDELKVNFLWTVYTIPQEDYAIEGEDHIYIKGGKRYSREELLQECSLFFLKNFNWEKHMLGIRMNK